MRRTWLKRIAAGSVVATGVAASSEAAALCPAQFPAPGFEHQIALTVTNPGAARGDTIIIATVNTQAAIAAGKMRADGGDIRIATSECSVVPFWIESGLNTPATKIWMRMPSVAAGSQQVDLFYGAPAASSTSSLASVFGAGLVSLYSFSEGSGASLADRVGANTMTLAGTTSWATGPLPNVGAVTGFAGGRLNAAGGGPTLAADFTALALVKPTAVTGSTAGIFGNYNNDGTNGWSLKLQGGAGQFMLLTNQGGGWCQSSGGTLVPNAWQLVGARRVFGGTNALLQNGAAVHSLCSGDTRNVNGPGPFEIGRQYNGSYPFPGDISITMLFDRALPDVEVAALDSALRIADPPVVSLAGAPPAAPTIGVATPNGTTASVAFTPSADTGDGPVTRFEVVCSPFGQASGPQSPLVVSGLAAGQPHKCAVRAVNPFGVGPWSADSNTFVPGGAPSIGSPSAASFVVFSNGAFTIVTAGQPTPTLSVAGALPAGLSVVGGVIQGTPASGSVGVYPLTLTATNGIVPDATQTLNLEVAKASQTIVVGDLDNQIIGPQHIQVSATASSLLAVALASTTPSVCTITGDTISLVSVGVCTISAAQAGNADFEAAVNVTKSFQIALPPTPPGDASTSTPDASTSTTPDASAPPDTTPPSVPPSKPTTTPDASTDPTSAAPKAIEGGGCQCDATGAPAPASGLLLGGLGLVFGLARRRNRSRK